MPRRIVHIFNPKSDPYKKNLRYIPPDPLQGDLEVAQPAFSIESGDLRQLLAEQRPSGLFPWAAFIPHGVKCFSWSCLVARYAVKKSLPKELYRCQDVGSTLAILALLEGGYAANERAHFHRARCRALSGLAQVGLPEKKVEELLRIVTRTIDAALIEKIPRNGSRVIYRGTPYERGFDQVWKVAGTVEFASKRLRPMLDEEFRRSVERSWEQF